MQVWAVSMMRDEVDVAYDVVMHMASEGVDGVIVADNRSVDGTRERLEAARRDADCEVVIVDDNEVGYYQAEKMTHLAHTAADNGASWVVPFDADEVWHASTQPLAEVLARQAPDVGVVTATVHNHYATDLDLPGRPFQQMRWRQRDPLSLPKVAVRVCDGLQIAQGNHTARADGRVVQGLLTVRHFPYRSAEQFISKARNGNEAYRATTLPRSVGQHWREYGEALEERGEEGLAAWWREAFYFENPTEVADLVEDPAPFRRFDR